MKVKHFERITSWKELRNRPCTSERRNLEIL